MRLLVEIIFPSISSGFYSRKGTCEWSRTLGRSVYPVRLVVVLRNERLSDISSVCTEPLWTVIAFVVLVKLYARDLIQGVVSFSCTCGSRQLCACRGQLAK